MLAEKGADEKKIIAVQDEEPSIYLDDSKLPEQKGEKEEPVILPKETRVFKKRVPDIKYYQWQEDTEVHYLRIRLDTDVAGQKYVSFSNYNPIKNQINYI